MSEVHRTFSKIPRWSSSVPVDQTLIPDFRKQSLIQEHVYFKTEIWFTVQLMQWTYRSIYSGICTNQGTKTSKTHFLCGVWSKHFSWYIRQRTEYAMAYSPHLNYFIFQSSYQHELNTIFRSSLIITLSIAFLMLLNFTVIWVHRKPFLESLPL